MNECSRQSCKVPSKQYSGIALRDQTHNTHAQAGSDVPDEEVPDNDDDVLGVRRIVAMSSGARGVAGEPEEFWNDDDDDALADDTADASTVGTTLGPVRDPDGY